MNVTRAPQGNPPQGEQPQATQQQATQQQGPQPQGEVDGTGRAPTTPVEALEQVRARIRAAQGAAQQARRAGAQADQALVDADLLRRRLAVVGSAAEQAMRSVRMLRGLSPASLWYAGRRTLADERARRAHSLRTVLVERDELIAQIADQDARARQLRAESLRQRAAASALPRLLDEAAACLRRAGGPTAEALAAAEAGLEPVLRRESDLDQALRWARWAQLHTGTALDRLGDRRAWSGYREYFAVRAERPDHGQGPHQDHGRGRPQDTAAQRSEAARIALGGVRDVLAVLGQALDDLGVSIEPVTAPQIPADLEPWFADVATDPRDQARVTAALEACEWSCVQLTALIKRLEGDHTATRRVLESRRAHWSALLRGDGAPGV